MSSSATGVGMPICFLGAILLILTQKSSQKFGDVLGIFYFSCNGVNAEHIGIDRCTDVDADVDIPVIAWNSILAT